MRTADSLTCERLLGGQDPVECAKTGTCVVLQYHRVASLCHDPLQMGVAPCNFERQMEYLAEGCHVISTDDIRRHLRRGIPFAERTVAITFDIGYRDTLAAVQEVLERLALPATVFVVSTSLLGEQPFWWDLLEDLLIADELNDRLEMEIGGQPQVLPLTTQQERFRAFDRLFSLLAAQTASQRCRSMENLAHQLGLRTGDRDFHPPLRAQEVRELDARRLITIGGHTHHCVRLSALSRAQQMEEIGKNKAVLEEVLGHPIEQFSYPFGQEDSCTPQTANILRDLGFKLAFGGSYGAISTAAGAAPYDVPRVKVGNWNPYTFHKFLEQFFA